MTTLTLHARLQKLAHEIAKLPTYNRIPLQVQLINLKAHYFTRVNSDQR